jgi:hypothetical protein
VKPLLLSHFSQRTGRPEGTFSPVPHSSLPHSITPSLHHSITQVVYRFRSHV